jgi:hypothetical protein
MSAKPQQNCMDCVHRECDRDRSLICSKVVGQMACEYCHVIADVSTFAFAMGGRVMCGSCKRTQTMPGVNDWREGYLGNPVDGMLTPLPCCPGFEPEANPPAAQTKPLKSVTDAKPKTRSLF